MWKYDGERLVNKNGDWIHLQETWISKEDQRNEGEAIVNSHGKMLKVDINDKGMHLKLRYIQHNVV